MTGQLHAALFGAGLRTARIHGPRLPRHEPPSGSHGRAHRKTYLVTVKARLQQPFFRRELCEIYHLKTDPLELHNLAGHLPESRIAKELSLLERRFDALRRNFETQPNPFHDVDPFGKRMAKPMCLH